MPDRETGKYGPQERWKADNLRTASTRITNRDHACLLAICEALGTTRHTLIKAMLSCAIDGADANPHYSWLTMKALKRWAVDTAAQKE